MDPRELGERICRARELFGSTQAALADKVGLDRSAISRIEQGERKVSVNELLVIAQALGRALSFFVAPAVPAVISRRNNPSDTHESNVRLDEELRVFASDVQSMLDAQAIVGIDRTDIAVARSSSHQDTERSADLVRSRAGLDKLEPVRELGPFCERFGLVTYSAALSQDGPDGACVEVGAAGNQLGVAVINGNAKPGRRRMTLAHELGHWLSGDAYDHEAPITSEPFVNSFAIHLLAPRAGVRGIWDAHGERAKRDRAIAVCAEFQLSWSASLGQLRNLDLITPGEFNSMKDALPKSGEFARLGLARHEDPAAPWLSPGYTSKLLDAYVAEKLTAERTVELLKGTISHDELPPILKLTVQNLRGSFSGHPA